MPYKELERQTGEEGKEPRDQREKELPDEKDKYDYQDERVSLYGFTYIVEMQRKKAEQNLRAVERWNRNEVENRKHEIQNTNSPNYGDKVCRKLRGIHRQ